MKMDNYGNKESIDRFNKVSHALNGLKMHTFLIKDLTEDEILYLNHTIKQAEEDMSFFIRHHQKQDDDFVSPVLEMTRNKLNFALGALIGKRDIKYFADVEKRRLGEILPQQYRLMI